MIATTPVFVWFYGYLPAALALALATRGHQNRCRRRRLRGSATIVVVDVLCANVVVVDVVRAHDLEQRRLRSRAR